MQRFIQKCRTLCWILILLLIGEGIPLSYARAADKVEVLNIRFEVVGNNVNIYYDLHGPANGEYTVSVILKRDTSSFEYTPIIITGDIGEVDGSGTNKKITWNILKEIPQGFEGGDFYFRIRVELVPPTSYTWLYITGGVVVAGGAAALLLLGSSSKDVTNQDYPLPPGRPAGY
jgi:hypothetical protein